MNPTRKSRCPRTLPLHSPRTPPPCLTPNIQRTKTHPLSMLLQLCDPLPLSIPLTHVVIYPRRNENATLSTSFACIAALLITQYTIAHISKAWERKALPNTAPIALLYPPYLRYPQRLLPLPPSLSSPLQETPRLRAPSDRITEGYYLGQFVDFVA